MTGLLCPGQGSQFVGMGRDLAEEFPAARATFEEADAILGFPMSDLCWGGPEDELMATMNAQPAILTHTVAAWRAISEHRSVPVTLAAGHSLGEFSAYVLSGAIGFADALRLVRKRGLLMFEAGQRRPGSMAAILGLDDALAVDSCRRASEEAGGVAVAANFNSPGQIVISGDIDAVRKAGEFALEAGARKVVPLSVSGAFHSPLMAEAADELAGSLEGTPIVDPAFPVVSNVTAVPVERAEAVRELLLRQLTAPVRWSDSVLRMIAFGVDGFLEIGPGNVLSGLLRRIDRSVAAQPLGTSKEVWTFIAEE